MVQAKERPLPELMETDPRAATVLADILAGQAAALHVVFMRGFVDVLSNRERSLRDVSRALKAQNQCRIALRLMLALRAAEQSQKKSRNRTNRLLKDENPLHGHALGHPLRKPARVHPNFAHKSLPRGPVRRRRNAASGGMTRKEFRQPSY
jgi:hypothetical protein